MKNITQLTIGMIIGAFLSIFIMMLDTPKKIDVIDDMSLCPPQELPKNIDENVKLPDNLLEVIL